MHVQLIGDRSGLRENTKSISTCSRRGILFVLS